MEEQRKHCTIAEVTAAYPSLNKNYLAQLRYQGIGPRYFAPTPRKIFYRLEDVAEWIEASARTSTAEVTA